MTPAAAAVPGDASRLRIRLLPPLSEKFKFAVKAALAVAVAYLIPLSQGLDNGLTAAITVMLIASVGSVGESFTRGMLRVAGTVLGAIAGMTLIALFPQERMLYLAVLSVAVTVLLYFARAYRGDTTVFMLTALTMMLVFKEGEVDDVFMYGVDRTLMTVLGIAVYTFVGILLWPVRPEDRREETAARLLETALSFFRENDPAERRRLVADMIPLRRQLQNTTVVRGDASSRMGLSAAQWQSIVDDHDRIGTLLYLLADRRGDVDDARLEKALPNYAEAAAAVETLLQRLTEIWRTKAPVRLPDDWRPRFDREVLREMSHLERAAVIHTALTARRLVRRLRTLGEKLNDMAAAHPTRFDPGPQRRVRKFVWFDAEDLKGAVITFLAFWSGIVLWIVFNAPQGFMITATATALTLITAYSAARPHLLIVLFSFSFLFAGAMYVFVLPQLHGGAQLGLFLFLYAFIGFYFLPAQLNIFFLLGIATFSIANDMFFSFALFLMILLVFYAFLFILLLLDYFPFSMKPETMVLILRKRFLSLASDLFEGILASAGKRSTFLRRLKYRHASVHLLPTAAKLRFWAPRIDGKYFARVDAEALEAFVDACEAYAYHLELYRRQVADADGNPLLHRIAAARPAGTGAVPRIESQLDTLLADAGADRSDDGTLAQFYELLHLHRTALDKLSEVRARAAAVDFEALKESRF